MQRKAHPLPPARWPLATPPHWRRGVMTLLAGCSALILATLAVAPSPAGAAAGNESAKPHKSAPATKPQKKTEAAKPHAKTAAAAAPKTKTTEAAKHKARHPAVGHPANATPATSTTPPTANLGEPKPAAASKAFEHGPGVLGMSLRTLRQEQIQEYVTEPVAMVALALDDLRFAPVNKGTHVEVNLADRIPFEGKGDKIAPKAKRPLDVLARILTDNPKTRIQVLVHTDDRGDPDTNLRQSQRAADAVKAYLVTKGVVADRITPIGRGSEAPLVAAAGRAQTWQERVRNQRVELVIEPLGTVPAKPADSPIPALKPPQGQAGGHDRPMLVK
ncbi:OmpA family protein [uncultured Thiodictyon sp.]|uniref:OmpA family protein n=1 Tax=uncultured Thiodictyon sp. TaxID=1846217 RepID=UPI0025E227D8|nr:OmpA family protein [uncultured Thiodictyon sp.]